MAQSLNNNNFTGIVDADGGFSVNGTQVIDSSGRLVESAGIRLADGDTFLDSNSNEMMEFSVTASAVNHIGVVNAATGNFPRIRAEGEADTGLIFDNSEAEEILILDGVASAVNEITITNAASGNSPIIAPTGSGTDLNINLAPKGAGNVVISGARGLASSVSTLLAPFIPVAVQQALSGAGAVNLTTYYTAITNTGADALTLADSTVVGQMKKVKMIVDPGTDSTLTFNTNATIVFADVGDYAVLMWNGSDWIPIELGNDADGATAPAYTPAS